MYRKDLSKLPIFIAPFVLGTGLFIGGALSVPHPEQCDITSTYHVHLYTKDIENITIQKWLHKENNTLFYVKHDNFLPVTTFDLEVYDKLDDYDLFEGLENIDYIHYQIRNNRDYMKFYYHYEETYTEKDEDGNPKTVTETYEGWSTNPRHRGVTGKTKVYHRRYYAYKLVQRDGKLALEKSPIVDDIRTILNEYPYVSETTNQEVSETFHFSSLELPYLNLEDFDPFYTPTVENNPLEDNYINNKEKVKMIEKTYW